MKSIIPARHLLGHFVLFILTALFLLTVMRTAYALWQFPSVLEANAVLPLFLQGLRFDIALIGMVLLVPVVLGSLLSVTKYTRGLAKFVVLLFLTLGLLMILVLELMTPWFIHAAGVRPDLSLLADVDKPLHIITTVFKEHTVPLVIGLVVSFLILIAFVLRLELNRFLRFRVFAPTGILMCLLGGLLCVMAIFSTFDLTQRALSPADSLISRDTMVNELALNTPYKMLYSAASPFLNRAE